MYQVFNSFQTGNVSLEELPPPSNPPGNLLIRSTVSLISAGTERMLVEFGRSNLLDKARSQPERLSQVFEKISSDGFLPTIDAINSKLSLPIPLGYCNVGIVIEVGDDTTGYSPGDRVVSNGYHAEYVSVPQNLCAKIPPSVDDKDAVFTVLSSIALHAIRLSKPTLGETYLVSGLGLIGILTCMLLKENGVNVLAIDPSLDNIEYAKSLGINCLQLCSHSDPLSWVHTNTSGHGVDSVIIAASTKSNEPVEFAASACRKRGRIVLIGVVGLELKRDLFYRKEISFLVSCSYGPGRYDPSYEKEAHDYPLPYVRWTEQRNFTAILNLISNSSFKPSRLVSHSFSIEQCLDAYQLLSSPSISRAILLTYNQSPSSCNTIRLFESPKLLPHGRTEPRVSFIGAGNHSSRTLIPAFSSARPSFVSLCAPTSEKAHFLAQKYGFTAVTTDTDLLLRDSSNAVVIATRHDSHASLITKALGLGKHVYVEKPLCLTSTELQDIASTYDNSKLLFVGFNRRFSPLVTRLQSLLSHLPSPRSYIYTINAGPLDPSHWLHDPSVGGGRLLGEACHFVDLVRFLDDSPILNITPTYAVDSNNSLRDSFNLSITFASGSIASINYLSTGHRSFPKETLQVFVANKVFSLNNFRKLSSWGLRRNVHMRLLRQDKGQAHCASSFLSAIKNGLDSPIPFDQIYEVHHQILSALNK